MTYGLSSCLFNIFSFNFVFVVTFPPSIACNRNALAKSFFDLTYGRLFYYYDTLDEKDKYFANCFHLQVNEWFLNSNDPIYPTAFNDFALIIRFFF